MMRTLSILAACLLSAGAYAQTFVAAPDYTPRAPAIERAPIQATAPASVRELRLNDAKTLLASTEGPAWRIVSVHAPACSAKVKRTECRPIRKQCSVAKKFAAKNKVHATCSALYTQASALMTTAPAASVSN